MTLMRQGKANQAIAAELCISSRTVEAHKARAIKRLGLTGPSALLLYAANMGDEGQKPATIVVPPAPIRELPREVLIYCPECGSRYPLQINLSVALTAGE